MNFKWLYKSKEVEPEVFNEIKNIAGSDIVTNLLINRGVTDAEQAKVFLNPGNVQLTPSSVFPDMQKAIDRINKAIQEQETIIIYGDFDSDGVTSTALMYKALKHLGANVGYYIPDRSDEGHGLNRAALCKIISTQKTKLIITVDCGISNVAEVKMAQNLGTDVIITDHHEPLEQIPQAYAIINPKMLDNQAIKYLAGVGVAYKLAGALLDNHEKSYYKAELLPLVAIGTVGDVVPLVDENRALVYRGLELINTSKPACIDKLMEVSGFKSEKQITSGILAFTIVPRINAIGRLSDALIAVEFLVTQDTEQQNRLAYILDKNNRERQQICEETFNQAEQKIENKEIDLNRDKAVILGDESWHPGIVGLVASRMVEKYYRPALLISLDEEKKEARCSARSIEGLNIFEVLSNFTEYFKQFGGHSLAAGFCANLEKISFADLKRLIMSHINKNLPAELLTPELKIDMDVKSTDLTQDFVEELDKLAPYGELNPYPVFSSSNLILKSCNTIGSKKNHLKIMLADDSNNVLEAVWWQKNCLNISPMEEVNVAFVPSINTFNNRTIVQLVLKDVQPLKTHETPVDCFICEEDDDEIQWLDHRNETGFKKEFLDYLNSRGSEVSVFAESQRALDIIEKVPFLKPLAVNRLNLRKTGCIVFIDFPSDDMTFVNVMKEVEPTEVHLFGILSNIDPIDLIKKVSGMFRYAYNEKSGSINITRAACSLAVSNDVLFSTAQILDAAGVIEIIKIKENDIEFNFNGSVNLNDIQELPVFHNYLDTLGELIEFKNECRTRDIELIKQILDNLDAFQCFS